MSESGSVLIIMFYHIKWCPYTMVICSVFNIMLLHQKQNVWAFSIIVDVTMKAVAFES